MNGDEAWLRDEKRSAYLHAQGLRVIRFENRDVMENMDGVLAAIKQQFIG